MDDKQVPSTGPHLLGWPFPPINTAHFSSSPTCTKAMENTKEERMLKSRDSETGLLKIYQ